MAHRSRSARCSPRFVEGGRANPDQPRREGETGRGRRPHAATPASTPGPAPTLSRKPDAAVRRAGSRAGRIGIEGRRVGRSGSRRATCAGEWSSRQAARCTDRRARRAWFSASRAIPIGFRCGVRWGRAGGGTWTWCGLFKVGVWRRRVTEGLAAQAGAISKRRRRTETEAENRARWSTAAVSGRSTPRPGSATVQATRIDSVEPPGGEDSGTQGSFRAGERVRWSAAHRLRNTCPGTCAFALPTGHVGEAANRPLASRADPRPRSATFAVDLAALAAAGRVEQLARGPTRGHVPPAGRSGRAAVRKCARDSRSADAARSVHAGGPGLPGPSAGARNFAARHQEKAGREAGDATGSGAIETSPDSMGSRSESSVGAG